jgi:methyl-accepting chemotaxis protein
MDKVTQQNAAMVEQTNAAAVQLQGRAAELNDAVARFNLGRAPAAHAATRNPVHQAQRRVAGYARKG